jgi:hypothetical protein
MTVEADLILQRQHAASWRGKQRSKPLDNSANVRAFVRRCRTPLSLALARSGLALIRSFTPKRWLRPLCRS